MAHENPSFSGTISPSVCAFSLAGKCGWCVDIFFCCWARHRGSSGSCLVTKKDLPMFNIKWKWTVCIWPFIEKYQSRDLSDLAMAIPLRYRWSSGARERCWSAFADLWLLITMHRNVSHSWKWGCIEKGHEIPCHTRRRVSDTVATVCSVLN